MRTKRDPGLASAKVGVSDSAQTSDKQQKAIFSFPTGGSNHIYTPSRTACYPGPTIQDHVQELRPSPSTTLDSGFARKDRACGVEQVFRCFVVPYCQLQPRRFPWEAFFTGGAVQ